MPDRNDDIFQFFKMCRPVVRPTQTPNQSLIIVAPSRKVKRPFRAADHSLLSSVEVKNAWR